MNAFSAASATTVNAGGTLDLGGFAQTVTSLTGGGTVTNGAPSGATLTVNDTVSTTFAGVIQDGLPPTGGQTGLAVQGPGAFILTGANTYTGATTIVAGVTPSGRRRRHDRRDHRRGNFGHRTCREQRRARLRRVDARPSTARSAEGSLTDGGGTLTLAASSSYTGPTIRQRNAAGRPQYLQPEQRDVDRHRRRARLNGGRRSSFSVASAASSRGLLIGTVTSTGDTIHRPRPEGISHRHAESRPSKR